jgi:hypothetical protein
MQLQKNGARRRLWQLLAVVLTVVSLAFVARQLGSGWAAAMAYPWQWRPEYLVLSMVLAQVSYMVLTRAWGSILRAISIRIPARTSYWIFILSNLGRYLPGRVWQVGAAAYLARTVGLNPGEIGASMIVYQLFLLPVGAMLSLSGESVQGVVQGPWLNLLLWAGCLAMAAAACWPHVLLAWIRPLTHRLGTSPERWRMEWSRKGAVLVQCAVGWVLLSLSFALLVISVTSLGWRDVPELSQVFLTSYIVGFVSLVTPGGLGIREGIMTLMLTPLAGAGPAAALAILSRLWVTVTEVIALLPAWWWYRRDSLRTQAPSSPSGQS